MRSKIATNILKLAALGSLTLALAACQGGPSGSIEAPPNNTGSTGGTGGTGNTGGTGAGSGSGAGGGTGINISKSSATLSWSAPLTDETGAPLNLYQLGGYKVYLGNSADSMTPVVDLADPTAMEYTVTGLSNGTYYMAVTAYDTDMVESALSAVIEINVNRS
ncbi:MAG: fibronectin type III domain-containing protein [Pseudomonadota bacterium]